MKGLLGQLAFGMALVISSAAWAAPKERDLGTFNNWHAYAYEEGGQTVCYMVTTKTPPPGSKKKIPSYMMVTHRPIEGSTDVFSYGAGTDLDSKHGAQLTLGKETFDLFSVKDTAWAREALTDHKIVKALRSNASAQIFSLSARGRAVTLKESFSLAGALNAYRAINKACGLPDVDVKPPPKKVPVVKEAVKKTAPKTPAKAPTKKASVPKKAAKTAVTPAKAGTATAKKVPKTAQ